MQGPEGFGGGEGFFPGTVGVAVVHGFVAYADEFAGICFLAAAEPVVVQPPMVGDGLQLDGNIALADFMGGAASADEILFPYTIPILAIGVALCLVDEVVEAFFQIFQSFDNAFPVGDGHDVLPSLMHSCASLCAGVLQI